MTFLSFFQNRQLNVIDTVGKLCVAEIVETRDNKVLIHYVGWSSKWDEWMPANSERIKGEHVAGDAATLGTEQTAASATPAASQPVSLINGAELNLSYLRSESEIDMSGKGLTSEDAMIIAAFVRVTASMLPCFLAWLFILRVFVVVVIMVSSSLVADQ